MLFLEEANHRILSSLSKEYQAQFANLRTEICLGDDLFNLGLSLSQAIPDYLFINVNIDPEHLFSILKRYNARPHLVVLAPNRREQIEKMAKKHEIKCYLPPLPLIVSSRHYHALLGTLSHNDKEKRSTPHSKKILLVEDNGFCQTVATWIFKKLQIQYEIVPDGPSALVALSNQPFSHIITDINLPGMSGNQLAAEISQLYPHLPIFGHTADLNSSSESLKQFRQTLPKPLTIDQVSWILTQV